MGLKETPVSEKRGSAGVRKTVDMGCAEALGDAKTPQPDTHSNMISDIVDISGVFFMSFDFLRT